MSAIIRSTKVKVKYPTPEFIEMYNDLQEDYRKYISFFFPLLGIGYGTEDENGNIVYTSPEEAVANIDKQYDKNTADLIKKFISSWMTGDQKSHSSYYAMFSEKFTRSGGGKLTEKRRQLLSTAPTMSEEDFEKHTESDQILRKFSLKQWKKISCRLKREKVEDVWKDISNNFINPDIYLGEEIRKALKIKCKHPNDSVYCRRLTKMVGESLRARYEIYRNHIAGSQKLKDEIDAQKENIVFTLLEELQDSLIEKYGSIGKKVLFNSIKYVKQPSNKHIQYQIVVDELSDVKYKPLTDAQDRDVAIAYKTLQTKLRLQKRKVYPVWNTSNIKDYKIPFGIGLLGNFDINENGTKISIDSGKHILDCCKSHYLYDLQVDVLVTNKKKSGFKFDFHKNRQKNRKNPSAYVNTDERTVGEVKEIGVLKVDKGFYIHIPINLGDDKQQPNLFDIRNFFQSAAPSKDLIRKMPDTITVAAVDLGMNNPIAICKAVIHKGKTDGNLQSLDYGSGELIQKPILLDQKGEFSDELIEIKQTCKKLINIIREYRIFRNTNEPMSDEIIEWFNEIDGDASHRYVIQCQIKKTNKRIKQIHKILRNRGYANIADSIRLIDALDSWNSLRNSYDRIHLKPKEQLLQKRRFCKKRANFRKLILERIAARIAKNVRGCNLVFLEDLETKQDSDSRDNSLARLFAAKGLTDQIEQTLQEIGIGVVRVNKNGTSKVDPITGHVAKRDGESIFVASVSGGLTEMHADLAASLNILLKGLNHSVPPNSLMTNSKGQIIATDDGGENTSKRMKRFVKEEFGISNPYFFMSDNAIKTSKTKKVKSILANTRLYRNNGTLITEKGREEIMERIEHLRKSGVKITKIDLSSDDIETYNAFGIGKALAKRK